MYGIFTYIHHRNQPNVGIYTIHGWYGIWNPPFIGWNTLNLFNSSSLSFRGVGSQRKPIPFLGRFCHDVVGFSSRLWFGASWPDPEIIGAYTPKKFTFFFCRAWSAPSEVTSNVEIKKKKNARRLTVRQHPKSVIKILDKTRTQSWYYLEHYQERPMAFGKAIPDQKGSNLWVARSLISCKWAAFSRSNCMFSYILLYASL